MTDETQVLNLIEVTAEEASAILQALNSLNVTGNVSAISQWLFMVEGLNDKLQPLVDTIDPNTTKQILRQVPSQEQQQQMQAPVAVSKPKTLPTTQFSRSKPRPNKARNSRK